MTSLIIIIKIFQKKATTCSSDHHTQPLLITSTQTDHPSSNKLLPRTCTTCKDWTWANNSSLQFLNLKHLSKMKNWIILTTNHCCKSDIFNLTKYSNQQLYLALTEIHLSRQIRTCKNWIRTLFSTSHVLLQPLQAPYWKMHTLNYKKFLRLRPFLISRHNPSQRKNCQQIWP